MGKTLLVALLAVGIGSAGAQDLKVAEEELKGRDYAGVEFQNYSGPYPAVETAEAIRAIGYLLAGDLERRGGAGRYLLKYSVVRAVDPGQPGLDADIFSIDREARVDHIDNIRRILAGYLESAWGYSPADARLLAVFITLYNAVYRGDLDYFGSRYKAAVMRHLSRSDAGLSTRYFEWPGATRMLVPLTSRARPGSLGTVGTDELTSKDVVEQMRSRPDKGLEERKEMVELKEREVAESKGELERKRRELEAKGEALAGEETSLAEERARLEAGKGGAATEEQRRETARREEALAARERAVQAGKAEAAREGAGLAREEAALRERESRIEEERREIVQEERSMPFQPARAARPAEGPGYYSDKLYYLWAREPGPDGAFLRSLSVLDPFAAGVHLTSPVSRITSPGYHFFGGGILVIACPAAPPSARLALLHPATLEPIRWSEEEVHPQGMIFLQGESVYTLVRAPGQAGGWRLGRFDGRLTLAARSEEAVRPESYLAAFGSRIYATDPGGRVLALDGQSLARRAVIERP